MSDIQVSYQNASNTDPQAKVETDEFSLGPGEVLVLTYVRRPNGTIEHYSDRTYGNGKDDYSTHKDDVRALGGGTMGAIQEANR